MGRVEGSRGFQFQEHRSINEYVRDKVADLMPAKPDWNLNLPSNIETFRSKCDLKCLFVNGFQKSVS